MACGTPVLAWNCGSVPEIIENGKSGYVVNSMEAAVEVAIKIHTLDRSLVRDCFKQRFTAKRMAEQYLDLYQKLILKNRISSVKRQKTIPINQSVTSVRAI